MTRILLVTGALQEPQEPQEAPAEGDVIEQVQDQVFQGKEMREVTQELIVVGGLEEEVLELQEVTVLEALQEMEEVVLPIV